jgi:hypothetical protein
MRRRRSGSERRKERRSRQPGQALDVAATLLWTRQRTHARTHAAITRIFWMVVQVGSIGDGGAYNGFPFFSFPNYDTLVHNSRQFSLFFPVLIILHLLPLPVLLEFIHQSIRSVSLSRL